MTAVTSASALTLNGVPGGKYSVVADNRVLSTESIAVSVVVPTRNRADLVADTIRALLAQQFGWAYEVIVVDNHSHDNTIAVLQQFAAADARCRFRGVQMDRDYGPAVSRNVGVALSEGRFVAFTDSDCIPSRDWLAALHNSLQAGDRVAQGRTQAPGWQKQPFFSHFIETSRQDGSFSTSNVAYQRDAILKAGGFDPDCDYWEDVDLGWRAVRQGANYAFAPDALVYHQVIPQTPIAWLLHATRFSNWPEKAARYPEFRRHLFLGIWVDWFHALLTLFWVGVGLSRFGPGYTLLTLPYLLVFSRRHGLAGKAPPAKALAHFCRDGLAFLSLLYGSIKSRRVVL